MLCLTDQPHHCIPGGGGGGGGYSWHTTFLAADGVVARGIQAGQAGRSESSSNTVIVPSINAEVAEHTSLVGRDARKHLRRSAGSAFISHTFTSKSSALKHSRTTQSIIAD